MLMSIVLTSSHDGTSSPSTLSSQPAAGHCPARKTYQSLRVFVFSARLNEHNDVRRAAGYHPCLNLR